MFLFAEGQYMVIDGVKIRHGLGTHANGKEKYVGEWQHDSMHGQGVKHEERKNRHIAASIMSRSYALLYICLLRFWGSIYW